MPLYEEFDPHAHRYYGGIVGRTFEETSDCFLNIRNVLVIDGILYAKVGVGIISESDPDAELAETHHKVSGLMRAVRLWEK
jgi:anthranilate/para-aminobenzoate synthase component I